jgi:AcrR family transcriptional regulator
MGLREEKKERQRREIMDAAVALFRERGYDHARVQDIIERLRISESTFFNYFPTKDAILHEFALDQVDLFTALIKHEIAARERSVSDRLREMMRVIAQVWSADREFMAVVVTRSSLFSATGEIRERELKSYDLFAELFREGQARGEIRADLDPMQLAEMLTGIYAFTGANWLIGWWKDSNERLEERLLRAVDGFLLGCRAASAEAHSAKKSAPATRHQPRQRAKD